MDSAGEILARAEELFDAAGIARLPEGGFLIVTGLESTPERDLDAFGHEPGGFRMYGFRDYAAPRLRALLETIRREGYTAELAGPYGYPLEGEINIKGHAIRAGLGKRGKNTVILHPVYGPRLRLMGIRTDAPLGGSIGPEFPDEPSPDCEHCTICLDVCPVRILEPYRMTVPDICLSNVNPVDERGRSILCDECLKRCPAGTGRSGR